MIQEEIRIALASLLSSIEDLRARLTDLEKQVEQHKKRWLE